MFIISVLKPLAHDLFQSDLGLRLKDGYLDSFFKYKGLSFIEINNRFVRSFGVGDIVHHSGRGVAAMVR